MPAKGQIVLFLRGDRPSAGVVDGEKSGKHVVLASDGKRLQIQPQAVLASGPDAGSGPGRDAARLWDDRLEQASRAVDVAGLWELLEGSGEMTAREIEEAWLGDGPPFEDRAALLASLYGDRVYFARRKDRFTPEPRARVEERLDRARDHERKEERIEALCAAVTSVHGGGEPGGVDGDDWSRFLDGLRDVAVRGPDARGAGEVLEVLRRAGLNATEAPFDLLVRLGVFSTDENLDLHLHAIRDAFSDDVLDEARAVLSRLVGEGWRQGREDATDVGAVTVDSERTLEVDDALSIRVLDAGWEIGIHIADVASFVSRGGALESEALTRGATLYMPDRTIPMMPPDLGRGGFSLDEGVDRPALSLSARVAPDGQVEEFRFAPTVLRTRRRLTYEQADALVQEGDEVLAPLDAAARVLRERRIAAGAVDLALPELDVHLDEAGNVHVTVTRGSTPSHDLVSECAILYNRLAGRLLADRSLPAAYRVQPEPDEELPDTAEGGPAAELAARRLLSPSATTTEPGRHFTLGIEGYATATSPIRRATDLLVQRQLLATCGLEPLSTEELDAALLAAVPAAATVTQIERSRTRYWLLRHLDARVRGLVVPGVVVDRQSDRILVHLPDYALEVPLRTRDAAAFRRGEEIEVRLDRADARRDTVRISLVRGGS